MDSKTCDCGCGQVIISKYKDGTFKKIIHGHNNRGGRNEWSRKPKSTNARTGRARARKLINNKPCILRYTGECLGRIEGHHVDGNPMNNFPENVLAACKSHHTFLDRGRITLSNPKLPEFYVDRSGKRRYKKNIVFCNEGDKEVKGRKSIPSKIIDIRGGTRHTHRPPRSQEPQPPEKMPPCPAHLDKEAQEEWKRAGEILESIGLMTGLDMVDFAAYCEAYSRWVRLCIERQEMEAVVGEQKIDLSIANQRILQYRNAYQRWVKAMTEIQRSGLVYSQGGTKDEKTDKIIGGIPKFNPYLAIEKQANIQMAAIRKEIVKACGEAYEQMIRAGTLIGMSPSSRAALKIEKPKPLSKAQRFMDRKNSMEG